MNSFERVTAAFGGHAVDRVPFAVWRHFYPDEHEGAAKLAETTIAFTKRHQLDLIKYNPRAHYHAEPWGTRYRYGKDGHPVLARYAVRKPEDWSRIGRKSVREPAFQELVYGLRLVREVLPDTPLVATIFTPLGVLERLAGRERVLADLRARTNDVVAALDAVTETFAELPRRAANTRMGSFSRRRHGRVETRSTTANTAASGPRTTCAYLPGRTQRRSTSCTCAVRTRASSSLHATRWLPSRGIRGSPETPTSLRSSPRYRRAARSVDFRMRHSSRPPPRSRNARRVRVSRKRPVGDGSPRADARSRSSHAPRTSTRPETRWLDKALWVVRDKITTKSAIDDLMADATTRGIHDVVVQVRGRGDAYYASKLEPRSETLADDGFDPLAHLVRAGAAVGVRVHAWGNVFFVWSSPEGALPKAAEHLVRGHPDWLLRPGGVKYLDPVGGSDWEGIYIDPKNGEAREHTLTVFTDIVSRYRVEGFHYDYVRYPQVTYADSSEDGAAVTALVSEGAKRLRKARPGIVISAAVFPDPDIARERVLQRWPEWARTGLVDLLCPMAYRRDTAEVARVLGRARAAAPKTRMWGGLMAYAGERALLREQVRAAEHAGCEGAILFAYDPMHRDLLDVFAAA